MVVNVNGANVVLPMSPAPESFTVSTADGITLFIAKWSQTTDKAKGKKAPKLLIVHGLGEHGHALDY